MESDEKPVPEKTLGEELEAYLELRVSETANMSVAEFEAYVEALLDQIEERRRQAP